MGFAEDVVHQFILGDMAAVVLDLISRKKDAVVVMEGSYVLDDTFMDPVSGILRNENTYGLFVNTAPAMKLSGNIPTTSLDLRLMRHILTFQRLFGSSPIDIVREWPLTRENNLKYVYPSWKNADGTFNSYLPYELAVLKSRVSRALSDAMENAEHNLERSIIDRVMSALDGVDEMPEGVEFSADSVIRQFIGPKEDNVDLTRQPNLVVGVPQDMYDALSQRGLVDILEQETMVNIVSFSQEREDQVIEDLSGLIGQSRGAALLIDPSAFEVTQADAWIGDIRDMLLDFSENSRRKLFADKDNAEAGIDEIEDNLNALDDISGIAHSVIRALPEGISYDLGNKSLRHIVRSRIKIEKMYRTQTDGPAASGYVPARTNKDQVYYFVHFADGSDIIKGRGPVIIPPGLEIADRRRKQGLDRESDSSHRDRFFVVVPEGADKEEFKRHLMDIWMLEGVVDSRDVVILDRKNEAYRTSDIYAVLKNTFANDQYLPVPENTGFRYLGRGNMLEYDDVAGNMGLLRLDVSGTSHNNLRQYEVLYALVSRGGMIAQDVNISGLINLRAGLFVYGLPGSMAVDIEEEVRKYYDLYREEILIKA